jgi:hypothetical protein
MLRGWTSISGRLLQRAEDDAREEDDAQKMRQ